MNAQPIDLPREPDFQLGELRVRPAIREITGPAGAETLEPRVMEVLVALARADGACRLRPTRTCRVWRAG